MPLPRPGRRCGDALFCTEVVAQPPGRRSVVRSIMLRAFSCTVGVAISCSPRTHTATVSGCLSPVANSGSSRRFLPPSEALLDKGGPALNTLCGLFLSEKNSCTENIPITHKYSRFFLFCCCCCLLVFTFTSRVFPAFQALRVVDYDEQALVAGFKSWFGGVLCLDWSPDGRYIVTGGEVGTRHSAVLSCMRYLVLSYAIMIVAVFSILPRCPSSFLGFQGLSVKMHYPPPPPRPPFLG